MDNLHPTLDSLTLGSVGATVRVRIGRMWDSVNLKSNDIFGFNMQLLDEQGGEIQAVVGPRFMPIFLGKLHEGLVYDISEFKVVPAGDRYLPIHKSINIDFNALTSVSEVDDNCEKIPTHKFSFADHKTILSGTDTIKYLTDVIGVLHQVGPVVNQTTGNGSATLKRELLLYLHCGTRIAVTLWGTKASLVDNSAVDDSTKTIIITSLTVKNYQGKASLNSTTATVMYTDLDTTKRSDLLKSFRKRKLPAITSDDGPSNRHTEVINDKCISDIMNTDLPNEYKGKVFAFEAKITGVNLDNGWEYLSCNICKKGVGGSSTNNYCAKCDREVEFPLHRLRLELNVEDGTASVPIVLFDKVAEFLLKQKADSLYRIQTNEVGGGRRVADILHQVVGRTEIFHAKFDDYITKGWTKKLTATRISIAAVDTSTSTLESSNAKVQIINDAKGNPAKSTVRKKNRVLYNIQARNWGHKLFVHNVLLQNTTSQHRKENHEHGEPRAKVDIHGQVDENITLLQTILHRKGIQVKVSPLMAPTEMNAALQRCRNEKRFLQHLMDKPTSLKVRRYTCSNIELEKKIEELENYIPFHSNGISDSLKRVTVRINNSISGVDITTKDLLTVLNNHTFHENPFTNSNNTYTCGSSKGVGTASATADKV